MVDVIENRSLVFRLFRICIERFQIDMNWNNDINCVLLLICHFEFTFHSVSPEPNMQPFSKKTATKLQLCGNLEDE